jgi:hypothetical protein
MDIDSTEEEIIQAAKDLGLTPDEFSQCNTERAREIVQEAQDTFVIGNPRAWWMSLKHPFESFDYPLGRGFDKILNHVPTGVQRCWLIPETEEKELRVFDVNVGYMSRLLGLCTYFEYYLVGKTFDWVLIENDHNQIIVSRVFRKA